MPLRTVSGAVRTHRARCSCAAGWWSERCRRPRGLTWNRASALTSSASDERHWRRWGRPAPPRGHAATLERSTPVRLAAVDWGIPGTRAAPLFFQTFRVIIGSTVPPFVTESFATNSLMESLHAAPAIRIAPLDSWCWRHSGALCLLRMLTSPPAASRLASSSPNSMTRHNSATLSCPTRGTGHGTVSHCLAHPSRVTRAAYRSQRPEAPLSLSSLRRLALA